MNQHELVAQIRTVVREENEYRSTLKKNGHSWRDYFWKLATPERIMLVVIAIFTFGGRVRDAQVELKQASTKAYSAATMAAKASADAAQAPVAAADATAAARDATSHLVQIKTSLDESIKKQNDFNSDISDRVRRNVTRSEFESALKQIILPRLDSIEAQVKDNGKTKP